MITVISQNLNSLNNENKNVLITGGSGYFGEILCKELINKNYNCTILDINPQITIF